MKYNKRFNYNNSNSNNSNLNNNNIIFITLIQHQYFVTNMAPIIIALTIITKT